VFSGEAALLEDVKTGKGGSLGFGECGGGWEEGKIVEDERKSLEKKLLPKALLSWKRGFARRGNRSGERRQKQNQSKRGIETGGRLSREKCGERTCKEEMGASKEVLPITPSLRRQLERTGPGKGGENQKGEGLQGQSRPAGKTWAERKPKDDVHKSRGGGQPSGSARIESERMV